MNIKIYKTGGFVRDRIMGLKSNDIDYAVEAPSFEAMEEYIREQGGEIFLSTPNFYTSRARIGKEVADYVLCRKESDYTDHRHPDKVEIGTLDDDLNRRDFSMNAIAMLEDGTYYDPHNGITDIENRIIRCVGSAKKRFDEDALRMIRAVRFSITKRMELSDEIEDCLVDSQFLSRLYDLPTERIYDELMKMCRYDTYITMWKLFHQYTRLGEIILDNDDHPIWLKPTTEER